MNDLFTPTHPDAEFVAGQAEAIRVLVQRTAADILDIGRRLIEVKRRLPHGDWLPWLKVEFGWTEQTARKFMRVAETLGKPKLEFDLSDCTIDAGALYMIAAPDAAPELREEVVAQARDGKRITLEEAEKIAAKQVAEAVKTAREEREIAVRQRQQLVDVVADLQAEMKERAQAEDAPTLDDAIERLCKATGKKKPSGRLIQALARELGEAISYGGKTYPPVEEQVSVKATVDLQKGAELVRVLAYFSGEVVSPSAMFELLPTYMRDAVRRNLPAATQWLETFADLVGRGTA